MSRAQNAAINAAIIVVVLVAVATLAATPWSEEIRAGLGEFLHTSQSSITDGFDCAPLRRGDPGYVPRLESVPRNSRILTGQCGQRDCGSWHPIACPVRP